jgi:hypothetical protein
MAKVTGPLSSFDARGQIAKAMVFMGWRGVKSVRMWVRPANPKTEDQGDRRLIIGGMGRSCKCVVDPSDYLTESKIVMKPYQSWISTLIQYIVSNYMKDGTDFDSEYTEYAAHTAKAAFDLTAIELGLTDFDIAYKGATNIFVAGLQLYELAKHGCDRAASGDAFKEVPFTTALASWTAAEIQDLQDYLTTVA